MKERLMNIHTGIYISYIITNFISGGTQMMSKTEYQSGNFKKSCQLQLVQRVFDDLLWVVLITMVLLQTYMSTKFSMPVQNSRQKFMLVYQAQPNLLQEMEFSREEHVAEQAGIERYERYQMAAIKDADLLIKLWGALTQD